MRFSSRRSTAALLHSDQRSNPIMMYFAGASPARRDFGRGYNAAQWARYCGRHMCAESIEKFVRTAVQHGGPNGGGVVGGLISFSSDSQQSLKVKKSKKNNGESRIRSVIRSFQFSFQISPNFCRLFERTHAQVLTKKKISSNFRQFFYLATLW